LDLTVRRRLKHFNDYKIKNGLLKRNFEEGINENYIVIKSLKTTYNLFLFSTYIITQNGQKVKSLFKLFYE